MENSPGGDGTRPGGYGVGVVDWDDFELRLTQARRQRAEALQRSPARGGRTPRGFEGKLATAQAERQRSSRRESGGGANGGEKPVSLRGNVSEDGQAKAAAVPQSVSRSSAEGPGPSRRRYRTPALAVAALLSVLVVATRLTTGGPEVDAAPHDADGAPSSLRSDAMPPTARPSAVVSAPRAATPPNVPEWSAVLLGTEGIDDPAQMPASLDRPEGRWLGSRPDWPDPGMDTVVTVDLRPSMPVAFLRAAAAMATPQVDRHGPTTLPSVSDRVPVGALMARIPVPVTAEPSAGTAPDAPVPPAVFSELARLPSPRPERFDRFDPVPITAGRASNPAAPSRAMAPTKTGLPGCPLASCISGTAAPSVALLVPDGVRPDREAALLSELGFDSIRRLRASFPVSRGQVRYFRTADAPFARALAERTGYEAIDLTWYRPRPPSATIELRVPGPAPKSRGTATDLFTHPAKQARTIP